MHWHLGLHFTAKLDPWIRCHPTPILHNPCITSTCHQVYFIHKSCENTSLFLSAWNLWALMAWCIFIVNALQCSGQKPLFDHLPTYDVLKKTGVSARFETTTRRLYTSKPRIHIEVGRGTLMYLDVPISASRKLAVFPCGAVPPGQKGQGDTFYSFLV